MKVTLCDPYAWEDPVHFLRNAWGKSIQCAQGRKPCYSEVINQILFIYLFVILASGLVAIFLSYGLAIPIGLLFATVYLIPSFQALQDIRIFGNPSSSSLEHFEDTPTEKVIGVLDKSPDAQSMYTKPTAKNPFMNVLIDEIKYNPTRPAAAAINDPQVEGSLDDVFRVQFLSDPTDVFGKTQSQRQFVAMPSTTIPNDQGSFADWLYRIPGLTCKEGGRNACLPGTDGGPVTWLNADYGRGRWESSFV
jgi:hypothetical protein